MISCRLHMHRMYENKVLSRFFVNGARFSGAKAVNFCQNARTRTRAHTMHSFSDLFAGDRHRHNEVDSTENETDLNNNKIIMFVCVCVVSACHV